MASVVGMEDREDSVIDGQRMSLLDMVEEKNRVNNKKTLLHRFVFVAKLNQNSTEQTEVGEYYDSLFKNLHNNNQNAEGVTGLMLVYPRLCVHVIESSTEMFQEILKDFCSNIEEGTGHIENAKVLVLSHDIPVRLYQQWNFRILDIRAPSGDDYETSESTYKVATDLVIQLLKLGSYLAKQPKLNLKNAMDSLHEKVPELLPQQDIIAYLVETEDSCISKPSDYLNKYYRIPFDVCLESEKSWPMPTRLFPYN
ncbi:unnamed protein product [Owenia fusiformis]|uniref:Uncharacterized protein n=1 Tax=Owenia fusiformis TaxID=6347 RepID=A0A8J1U5J5_OWEFU|nr:unnamed protein product [Owenia fusiformis]